MCSISPDQHRHIYKKSIDIPPRKLRSNEMFDSPKSDDAVFSKFLPYNNVDEDDDDLYSSDHFRIYEFKVRKCTRSRSHDWTDCPFAHPGEKARRRDPRRFHYSGTVCSEFRKGGCSKGDNCEFSHGVFECWLHPSRYRTEACKDGKNCKRKICFFAHSTRQLRIVPESSPSPPRLNSPTKGEKSFHHHNHCCHYCHNSVASPTSTLSRSMGHVSSPPPVMPEVSRDYYGGLSYKEALNELMSSMETMNVNELVSATSPMTSFSLPWVDVNFGVEEQQPQFVMSPSSSIVSPGSSKFSGSSVSTNSRFARAQEYYTNNNNYAQFNNNNNNSGRNLMEEINRYNNNNNNNEGNLGGPDLGWVNDLLT